jgi:pimeloyl-ACP methyl ester carboxylesterase
MLNKSYAVVVGGWILLISILAPIAHALEQGDASLSDDFERQTLEGGAITYTELTTAGKVVAAAGSVARVSDGRLVMTGVNGETGLLVLGGFDSSNVSVSMRAEFENQKEAVVYSGDGADQPRHTLGLIFRVPGGTNFGHGTAEIPCAGMVSVEFLNNGGLLVRERNASGSLVFISNKKKHSLTGGPLYAYQEGCLGASRNDQPFDLDDDGVLEAGEPFTLSVLLVGRNITVSINDQPIFIGKVMAPAGGEVNEVSLLKGRPGKFSNGSTLLIDDLKLSPEADTSGGDVPSSTEPIPVPVLELESVSMIWNRGEHQAFTDLIRYRDQWVCAFREAPKHDGGIQGSKIIVLTSTDRETWTFNHEFDDPRGDVRDAKLSINPQGELVLLTAIQLFGATSADDSKHQSIAVFTNDLKHWGDPLDVLDDGYWLWGLSWNKADGYGYSIGYRADYTAHLYRTRDGRRFERISESMDAVTNKPNESAIVFDGDYAFCLLRAFGPAYIGTAQKPFKDWSWNRIDQPIGGPEMIQLPDGTLLGAGRLYLPDKIRATSLFKVDPHRGTIRELLRLPSGGDTSYPGLVYHNGILYLSYYSSHEGKTSIYFATVSIDGDVSAESDITAPALTEKISLNNLTDPKNGHAIPYLIYEPTSPPSTDNRSLLIYLYGRGGSVGKYNFQKEPYAKLRAKLAQRGFYVLVPELGPNHFMNDQAKQTLDALVDRVLSDYQINSGRVHIMGTSMGGGAALAYTIHRPDLIRSVCAVMPMTDLSAWVIESPRYAPILAASYGGTPKTQPEAYDINSAINFPDSFADIPVLLIHGKMDTTVRYEHSRKLNELLQSNNYQSTLYAVEDLKHSDDVVRDYQIQVADFFNVAME